MFVRTTNRSILPRSCAMSYRHYPAARRREPHYINRLRKLTNAPIVYADPRGNHRDIEQADTLPVDYLLLDTTGVKHAYGGSGKTFDWSLMGEVNHPYFSRRRAE